MKFYISHAFYMPFKTNSTSVCRANVDLLSINCRDHRDAKFSSLLLFPLPPHGSETWTAQANESVRIKNADVKFSKWIKNYETKNIHLR
jgi:hypothetical protein